MLAHGPAGEMQGAPKGHNLGLHWQIIIGLAGGAVVGGLLGMVGGGEVVATYIRPIGTLFIRLITMIAAPLVLASLIVGASSITEPSKLGRIGVKTVGLFLFTTAAAITIGLAVANLMRPGAGLPADVSARLLASCQDQAGTAAVPGAGMVMLVIVLEAVGVPVEGIALIFGMDRLLDMCRTVINVTGDAAVAVIVAATEGELDATPDAQPALVATAA